MMSSEKSKIIGQPTEINLKELMNGGTQITVNYDENEINDQIANDDRELQEAMNNFTNLEMLGLKDDELYTEGEPFDNISAKMTNLDGKGAVRKYIVREGYGERPTDKATVKVNYNAYIEYESQPFDSTYARNRPHSFRLNDGEVILGLDLAVQSMKLNEIAQFLIKPELAYGKMGVLGRIPPNSTVLFEVELVEYIDSGAISNFESLPADKQKEFQEVYNYCIAACVKAKDLIKKNIRSSIREYNIAINKLENACLLDMSEQEKQQQLLLRLYTNLLICYTKIEEAYKGCSTANKIYEITKDKVLKPNVQVYFNNARCLRMIGEYALARKRLRLAYEMEPKNTEIANEFINIDNDMKMQLNNEKKMAQALLK